MSNNKWCRTIDGKEINLFDPDTSLFTVDRIANALARINRFAGHWERAVSVARHSMCVAKRLRSDGCDIETQLQGLFHDAAEAFTTDIPSPLKKLLFVFVPFENERLGYYKFEDTLLRCIFDRLEIGWSLRPEVHIADRLLTEHEKPWVTGKECDLYRGLSTDPEVVAAAFKLCAGKLFHERAHVTDLLGEASK
jgi:ribosomal protein L17